MRLLLACFLKTAYSRKNSFRLVQLLLLKEAQKAGLYAKSVNGDAFLMMK
jgi:trans-2-enoyl-CoA reductase